MLIKYLAKPINIVLALALLSFLWGSICLMPGWAMEEEQEKEHLRAPCKPPVSSFEESSFKDSPTEVVQLILSFLPLDSFVPVNQVCKAFQALASDEHGPFKDFVAFKKAYKDQKNQLLKLDCAGIMALGQTLSNIRKSLNILTATRSQEELAWLATQLFEELKTQDEKSNHFTDRTSHLGKMWPPLASLRACDAFWTPAMEEWLKTTALNKESFPDYDRRNYEGYDAFTLLGESVPLRSVFTALTHDKRDEEDAYLVALELCERDQESVNFIIDVAQKHFNAAQKYFNAAQKYFNIAQEKDSDTAQQYSNAAQQYSILRIKSLKLAAKYYTIALEKKSDLPALHINAAHAYSGLCAYDLALQHSILALENSPDPSPDLYTLVGSCYGSLRNWPLALKYYSLAIEKSPDPSPGLYSLVGFCYKSLGNWPLALKYYSLVIEKSPDPDARGYIFAGDAASQLEDWDLAADYYSLALEAAEEPQEEDYLKAGYASAKAKQSKNAAAYFEKFINLIEEELEEERPYADTEILYDYGDVLPPDALDLMEEVLTINNPDVPFHDWINGAKRRRLERESLSAPQEPSIKTSTTDTLSPG